MLRLKLNFLLLERNMTAKQLSELTGVRYPTVLDMADNKSKAWSPENLGKIYKALGLESVGELIEYVEDKKTPKA
ncbi:hypothetical protein J41TS12_41390 [Paenibacillus antibioticophila]|uniref:HTH cro/C1-type domain-containing protein n=1 Tax=Paenibacillus antibioticophila TaxID=1274374 RepID=A0A919XX52_9BACL|nr:helix-turn-helix transcriptional regulator [Paenibacillus antibioticophila]GIO39278.1 hypothetical protein J41TS12_41390 [Paenibacillus antibioticophila]